MEPHAHYVFWLACIYPPFGELLAKDPDRALGTMRMRMPDAERRKLKELLDTSYSFTGAELIGTINDLLSQKLGPAPPPPPPWEEIPFVRFRV